MSLQTQFLRNFIQIASFVLHFPGLSCGSNNLWLIKEQSTYCIPTSQFCAVLWLAGQEIEVKIRFMPHTTGPITLFGVCNLVGAPLPCGFAVSRCVQSEPYSWHVQARWEGR